jgi:hypothetical protein
MLSLLLLTEYPSTGIVLYHQPGIQRAGDNEGMFSLRASWINFKMVFDEGNSKFKNQKSKM